MKTQYRFIIPNILLLTLLVPLLIGCGENTPVTPNSNNSAGNGRIYATRSNGSQAELLSMNADGTDQRVLRQEAGVICSPQAGKMIIATDSNELLLADLDGNVIRTIPTVGAPAIAVLSPDASKIGYGYWDFESSPDDEAYTLRVVNADGTGDVLLTDRAAWQDVVAFSPDSRKVAFYYSENLDTPHKLYIVNTDGGGMQLVTDNARSYRDDVGTVAWSPDGKRLLFHREPEQGNDDYATIWSIATDGSDARELTDLSVPAGFFPRYSPDGSMIAFIGVDSTVTPDEISSELWVMNSDGSNKRRLTDTPGRDNVEVRPEWSPDGKSIAYISFDIPDHGDPFTGKLMSIDVATGEIKTLIATPDIFSVFWGRK